MKISSASSQSCPAEEQLGLQLMKNLLQTYKSQDILPWTAHSLSWKTSVHTQLESRPTMQAGLRNH